MRYFCNCVIIIKYYSRNIDYHSKNINNKRQSFILILVNLTLSHNSKYDEKNFFKVDSQISFIRFKWRLETLTVGRIKKILFNVCFKIYSVFFNLFSPNRQKEVFAERDWRSATWWANPWQLPSPTEPSWTLTGLTTTLQYIKEFTENTSNLLFSME
jgi:hypothetical protein